MTKENTSFAYLAASISALGGFLFGYDTAVISSAILFIKKQFNLTATMEEFVLSCVLIGAMIGALVGGKVADRFGRRRIIIVVSIVFTVGALWTALAPTIPQIIIGRLIIGVAIGISSFAVPLYISEIAPASIRGKLVSLNQLAITVGILISYFIGYAFADSPEGWRAMFVLAIIPSLALGIGIWRMPDSPRYLIKRGETVKAIAVLQRIRKTKHVDEEIQEITSSVHKKKGSWKDLLHPFIRPALIIGIGLAIFQQITGINTIIYYAPTIFEFAGFATAQSAILATIGVGIVNVLSTILALQIIDRLGRRPLLLIGLAGMTLSLFALGIAFKLFKDGQQMGVIAAICVMVYIFFFAISLGPIAWLLIAEIYPLKIRGVAMSTATFFNWTSNFIVGVTFLTLINFLGESGTFWLYGILSIGTFVFIYFLVPETKKRSLEQIEKAMHKRKKLV